MGRRRKRRTPRSSGHRPPSPARAALANRTNTVAGEGSGVGGHRVVVRSLACDRHQPQTPERRRGASTWSTACPPSSHAVRADARSERPRSRTDRRPRGTSVVSFDRAQERDAKRCVDAVQMREPAPADRWRGSHRMGRRRTRRTPSSSRPSATVPPLPREPLCPTRTSLSRGRGGGGGTTSCRPVVGT